MTVKFKCLSTVKKTHKVLVAGGTEAFINRIKVDKISSADCKVKKEAVAARSPVIANRRKITSLTVVDPQANHEESENLVDTTRELAEIFCTLQKDVLDYFKNLLSPSLAMKWQLIVEEEVVGVDDISLTGAKPGLTRGMDFLSLIPCYSRLLNLLLPRMQLRGFTAI